MKIFDISQEVFSCAVYPGDPYPAKEALYSMERGDLYNLTAFSMCAHNGTHIDAPAHFLREGKTVEDISLSKLVGMACVIAYAGNIGETEAGELLRQAAARHHEGAKRLLFKGRPVITAGAAEVFARAEVELIGIEAQSVGPEDAPMEVHKILLSADVVLLEGIRLDGVAPGEYLLNAAPLSLAGAEGAPCRAILISI